MTLIEKFNTKLSNIIKTPELKERIIFTLIMFLVARIGALIPSPGVDLVKLEQQMANNTGILGYINMFAGGAFQRMSIFSLGIVPYINASILFSLLAVIVPKIEEIQKEGESGRNKITQWTRYVTIVIAGLQSFGTCLWLKTSGLVEDGQSTVMFFMVTMMTMTAGTIFLMWIGEQISVRGIGNGVSLLIFLNIISGAFPKVVRLVQGKLHDKFLIPFIILIVLAGILLIMGVVTFQLGQRKIPVHYVGKGFGGIGGMGHNSYIPLKLNSAGVMPVIFASVAMMVPTGLIKLIPVRFADLSTTLLTFFNYGHPIYMGVYAVVIIFFSFFYTSIVFDPEKVAENLKQAGGTIPGIRPGIETVEYLEGVVTRITWGGAFFLAGIALLPQVVANIFGYQDVLISGTGIIIVVGVAIDTIQQIDAHLVMREYRKVI